jgi:hypothetical protein
MQQGGAHQCRVMMARELQVLQYTQVMLPLRTGHPPIEIVFALGQNFPRRFIRHRASPRENELNSLPNPAWEGHQIE